LDGVHLHCGWSIRTSVVLSGSASRHTSVTDSFDRESFNSVEQTFTVVMVSFMIALSLFSMGSRQIEVADGEVKHGDEILR
jgi:hypothetical protein